MTATGATIDWRMVLQLIGLVLWIAVGVYTWIQSRQRATTQQVDGLARQVEGQQREIAVIVERLRHLPTAREVAELTTATRELSVEFKGVREQMQSVHARCVRIEDYLHGRPTA